MTDHILSQNELIKIETTTISGEPVKTCNARDLHASMEVSKDFSNWAKAQIKRARLVENRDFLVIAQKGENLAGGRPTIDYHLTLDSAKHIKHVPIGQEIFRNGKIKVLQHEHKVVQ